MKDRASFIVAIGGVVCAGSVACNPPPPALAVSLRGLQREVQSANPITLSDLDPRIKAAWAAKHPKGQPNPDDVVLTDAQLEAYEAYERDPRKVKKPFDMPDYSSGRQLLDAIHISQCLSGTGNPLMPAFSGAFSLAVQSSINEGLGATATASGSPTGAVTPTFTLAKQQAITVPVTFVTAANLGNFYLSQAMAFFPNTTLALAWRPAPDAVSWPTLGASPPAGLSSLPNPPSTTATVTGAVPDTTTTTTVAPPALVSPFTPPPAPGSQLARFQVQVEQVLQTQAALEEVVQKAFTNWYTGDAKAKCPYFNDVVRARAERSQSAGPAGPVVPTIMLAPPP